MVMKYVFQHYTAVSARLGLVFEDGRIHGAVDGVSLQMWFGAHSVHVGALLPKPSPVELSIATKGLIEKLGDLFGGHDGEIGDPAFDAVFSIKAPRSAKIAALLDPAARKALLDLAEAGLHPAVDAHSIHLRRFSNGALSDSEEVIERDLREAARLAKVIADSFVRTQH
ncbi:hypothetical protein BH09MYX1_BH09MYX1_13570 [soil metagenome]